MTWRQRTIDVPGGARLNVRLRGAGPAVLFLHGIGGRARQWMAVAERLSHPCCAIAWDARGYGDSVGPGVAAFPDFADDLRAVLDALGVARALGVGHSMGGRILIEAAASAPERFAGLFLSGAPAAHLPHLSRADREAYVARRMGMFEAGRVAPDRARAVAREVLPKGAPEALVAELAADFEALRPEGYGAALAASSGWDRTGDLGRLDMPCELMGGALDAICPPDSVRDLGRALRAGTVTILDGVAHMAQLEAPDMVAGLVSDFVARNALSASTVAAGSEAA